MELKHVVFEKRDGIGWIQIDRPEKLNALHNDVLRDLEQVVLLKISTKLVTGKECFRLVKLMDNQLVPIQLLHMNKWD